MMLFSFYCIYLCVCIHLIVIILSRDNGLALEIRLDRNCLLLTNVRGHSHANPSTLRFIPSHDTLQSLLESSRFSSLFSSAINSTNTLLLQAPPSILSAPFGIYIHKNILVQQTQKHTQVYSISPHGVFNMLLNIDMPHAQLAGSYFGCAHMQYVVLESLASHQLHYLNLETMQTIPGRQLHANVNRLYTLSTVVAEYGVHLIAHMNTCSEISLEALCMRTGRLMHRWQVKSPSPFVDYRENCAGLQMHANQLLIHTQKHIIHLCGISNVPDMCDMLSVDSVNNITCAVPLESSTSNCTLS